MLLTNRNKRLYSCFPFSRITEGPPKEIDILFCDSMGNIEKSIITSPNVQALGIHHNGTICLFLI